MPRTRATAAPKVRNQSLAVPGMPLDVVGSRRDLVLLNRIRDLIADEDIDEALETLRAAMKATTSVRAPRTAEGEVQHSFMPDWGARLCSVRLLLAYKYGLPPKHHEITLVPPGAGAAAVTPQEHLAELIDSGADLQNVLETWIGAMKQAQPTPAEPVAGEISSETAQTSPQVEVLEV